MSAVNWAPVIASGIGSLGAIITAIIAVSGYKSQKKIDERSDLLKLRRDKYQDYLSKLHFALAHPKGHSDHTSTHDNMVEARSKVILVASDRVIGQIGVLTKLLSDSSSTGEQQFNAYASMIHSMREESFEKSELTQSQLKLALPLFIKDADIKLS